MKRPTYLESGQRKRFGRPAKRPLGAVEPAPDPAGYPDFELGTWRVRPALGRMTRADRIVALDAATLRCLLVLHSTPEQGVTRAVLAARVYDPGTPEEKLRRCLSFLRRLFAEDGSVRIENAPGDRFVLRTGPPVPGRTLRGGDGTTLSEPATAVDAWLERPRRRLLPMLAAATIVAATIVGMVYVLGGPGHALRHKVLASRAFAAEPGQKTQPSFSPDGRRVVYAWAQPGEAQAHLYVRAATGGEPQALTRGPGDDRYPTWSPGGGLIGFARFTGEGCELWTILADGSNARRVGDCAPDVIGPMAFSRDGRGLTFPNRTSALLASQLVALNLNTGALSGVTNPTAGMPGDSLPALSQNSRRLAFVRTRSPGAGDIALVERSAGGVERVTRDFAPIAGLTWEPDARTLLFASARSGPLALWSVSADGGTPAFVLGGDGDLRAPALSADGHQLLVERVHRTTRLASAALEGPARLAAPAALLDPVAWDRQVAWSADRSRFAFVSDRSGQTELWLGDARARTARQLTNEREEWLSAPRWTPDGRGLVVVAGSHGQSTLCLVDAGTGARRVLVKDPLAAHPAFSRDGTHLYYSTVTDNLRQVWRRNWPALDGAVQITDEGGAVAEESSDGRRLYFVRPDRVGLWSRDTAPGGDETLLTADLIVTQADNWFVSGIGAYFVARGPDGNWMLARYGEDTEAVSLLRPLPGLYPGSGLAPGPDGTSVVYAQETNVAVDLETIALE